MPLGYFKHVSGKIVKRSSAEIQKIKKTYQQARQAKQQELQRKEQEITAATNIVLDKTKTPEERIEAIAKMIEKGVI